MKYQLLKPLFLVASARAKQRTAHFPLTIILLQLSLRALPAAEFHVAITGSDASLGTQAAPLRTIQRAADLAQPGDTVTVHAGVYRERVNPPRGGESDAKRIVYQAATGEKVVITGSEEVKNWEKVQDGVWKAPLPNTFFGSFNPYTNLIHGDWFQSNGPREHHTGAVYLNGDWLGEAAKLDEVLKPAGAAPLWFGRVDQTNTTLWAQFKEVNPNAQRVEINTRQTVFYPRKPGINYITVRGFTLRHAATQWAPPTAEQMGLIGTHWSKGWIIENNTISHSKCTGIALGKYGDQWDNTSAWKAEGYVETIQRALTNGWNKATVGSHLVRNNDISHCEQAGVVGSLGCSFSVVTGNNIHDIHVQRLFGGVEMAGIKFHGAIDVEISRNHLYRCDQGIWLDWMAQGARVSGNLLHDNLERDLFFEANHGPFLVDNNVCLSPVALWAWSEGGAYVHNLFAGKISTHSDDDRMTPFHQAHSTAIAGMHKFPSGDDRYYNNVFMRSGSLAKYDQAHLPMWMDGNVFFQGTKPSKHESAPINRSASDPGLTLVEKNDAFHLTMTLATALGSERPSQPVTSARLGKASISGCAFENPDGSPITIGTDYFGKPRNAANPTPGPFEAPGTGTLTMKVWPLAALPASSEVPYLIGRGTDYQHFTWDTTCPPGCPFPPSSYRRLQFTGRWATYTTADTFYPTWGSDDVLYSPWADGGIGELSTACPNTGHCSAEGDSPLHLTIGTVGVVKGNGAGYGLYPCGSLMYNDIWYHGNYLLTWTDPDAPQDMPDWGVLEPFVGFRYSSDKGLNWTDPTDSAVPLLEPHHNAGKGGKEIMIGAPHFVDFGKNMQHAPVDSGTGRKFAYMVAHGADPGIQIAAHNSWIQGDNIYVMRVLMPNGTKAADNAGYLNTHTNWQYYARNGEWKNWDKNNLAGVYGNIQAIARWPKRLGNVSMTYNAALGKYMMVMSRVVTGNKDAMDAMLLEADSVTGPFRLVQYLPSFGVRAYFLNIPSKFISADGLTMWLSFSANYWWYTSPSFPGSTYAWCWREFKLSADPKPIHLSGKIEAECGTKLNGAGDSKDASASHGYNVAFMGGLEFTGLAKADSLTIRYSTVTDGTISLYINGAHAKDITVHSTGAWNGDGAYTNAVVDVAVPDGASLRLQKDSGDVGINLDYITLSSPSSVKDIRTSGQGGGE